MKDAYINPLLREDTFFGVCEGLGEDLGIHPNFLRLAFAVGLYFSLPIAIGSYLALFALVQLARWLVPNPNRNSVEYLNQVAPAADNDASPEPEERPIAA